MATSKLQRKVGDMLDNTFPQFKIRENYRPDWMVSSDLTILELDFFIEDPKIAIEVQGAQHFEFIPFFHKDEDDYRKRKRHDLEKRDLCRGRRVKFYEICTETDALVAIKDIQEQHCKQPKYSYSIEHHKSLPTWGNTSLKHRQKLIQEYGSEKRAKKALRRFG